MASKKFWWILRLANRHNPAVRQLQYDVPGREVATLVSGRQNSGSYTVTFNAGKFASGVYFYRLTAASDIITRRMPISEYVGDGHEYWITVRLLIYDDYPVWYVYRYSFTQPVDAGNPVIDELWKEGRLDFLYIHRRRG